MYWNVYSWDFSLWELNCTCRSNSTAYAAAPILPLPSFLSTYPDPQSRPTSISQPQIPANHSALSGLPQQYLSQPLVSKTVQAPEVEQQQQYGYLGTSLHQSHKQGPYTLAAQDLVAGPNSQNFHMAGPPSTSVPHGVSTPAGPGAGGLMDESRKRKAQEDVDAYREHQKLQQAGLTRNSQFGTVPQQVGAA